MDKELCVYTYSYLTYIVRCQIIYKIKYKAI